MGLFDRLVEIKIKEAIQKGEMQDPETYGKPLDLTPDPTPAHLRMYYKILKNANIIPEEVQVLKEIEQLKLEIKDETSEKKKRQLYKKLNDLVCQFNLYLEKNKQRGNL